MKIKFKFKDNTLTVMNVKSIVDTEPTFKIINKKNKTILIIRNNDPIVGTLENCLHNHLSTTN